MEVVIDQARCIRCKTCEVICPTHPSVFAIDAENKTPNQDKCINCKVCVTQCPVQAITVTE